MTKPRRGPRSRTSATRSDIGQARGATTRNSTTGSGTTPWYPALIVAVCVLTYSNSLRGPFVFDDPQAIERNTSIRQLSTALSPPVGTPVSGRPVVNLSFAINYALGGLDVAGYHVFNLAIHVLAALVFFGIVRWTLAGVRMHSWLRDAAAPLALAAALIWALHPIQSEVINYLTQRSESMAGLLVFLTLYFAIRAKDSEHAAWWEAGAVAVCALGMLTKESVAVAPLIVILYDRLFTSDSWRDMLQRRWRLHAGLAATWMILATVISSRANTIGFSTNVSATTYLLNQCQMIVQYLRVAFWPHWLVLDYGFPKPLAFGDVAADAAIVGTLLMATLAALVRWPKAGFLGAAFFLTLAPTSSVIPIATEVGAERRMYLPLALLAVLVVLAARLAWTRLAGRSAVGSAARGQRAAVAATTTVACVIVALAARTAYRNAEYADPIGLWRTLIAHRPHGRVHSHLAVALIAAGRESEAVGELRSAVRDYPDARFMLGSELIAAGKTDEGISELQQFIREKPGHPQIPQAYELLGAAFTAQGKLADAAQEFQRLVDRAPVEGRPHGLLADALFQQNRFEEALVHYKALLAREPDIPQVLEKMGIAQGGLGRLDEAIASFQRAALLNPQSASAERHLANAFLQQQNAPQAQIHATQAIRLAPSDPAAHNILGYALASQGRFDQAIAEFKRTLEMAPADERATEALGRASAAAAAARAEGRR